jgi:ATP-binding cassette subfamily C protein CydCD
MKPLDPRLLHHARRAAVHIGVLVALGVAAAVLIVTQARLLAGAISGAFLDAAPRGALTGTLVALAVVFAVRALIAWATEASSYRASAAVKSALRRTLLAHAIALGPRWLAGKRTGELVTLATQGIDSLDSYFAAYLPQLVLAVVIPLVVVVQIASADVIAGVTIALTLPLIPLFGALVGRATAQHTRRRLRALGLLSHHFLDVVAGLPTLKVFGRAKAQAETIRKVTGDYRRATMGTLRLAFLSSLVLELTATLSVALVAVGIGLRLVYGHVDLRTGLFVLILAPEAYLPIRQAAAQFHASADGLAAVAEVFDVLETPAHAADGAEEGTAETKPAAGRAVGGAERAGRVEGAGGGDGGRAAAGGLPFAAADPVAIRVEGVSVRHPGRAEPAPHLARLTVGRGEIVAVTGSSGCGKSTLLSVLLGFSPVSGGHVLVQGSSGDADLSRIDLNVWRSRVAWLPQDPVLFNGTVASNIRLGWPDAPPGEVAAAAAAAALDDVMLDTPVGERGVGLSAGQRRRVALARALLPGPAGRARPVLLLDEPTAGLDPAAEARVLVTLRRLAAAGRAVLVVTHKPAALAAADRVIAIGRDTQPIVGQVPVSPDLASPGLVSPDLASAVPVVSVPVPAVAPGHDDRVHRLCLERVAVHAPRRALPRLLPRFLPRLGRPRRRPDGHRQSDSQQVGGAGSLSPAAPAAASAPSRYISDSHDPVPATNGATLMSGGLRASCVRVRLRGGRRARWRLALAAFAGTCAAGSAIALTGTAAWLISRAAQHPPVLVLMVAITAVRAFGIGRGVFRYLERLAGHDAALRFLAGLRVAAYRHLERLAPAGLAVFRSGDLVRRLVADIDGLADRWLRVLLPYLVAGAAGGATVAVIAALLPAAGVAVAVSLLAAALLAPWLAGLVARRAERQVTPRRGALAAASLDLLRGAGEIAAFGAQDAALRQVSAADLDVSRSESRSGLGRGTGAAVAALAAGAAVWGSLYLGVGAVRSGALPGAVLAVVVLVPLAAHEIFSGLAPAAQQLPRIQSAAARVSGLLSAPDPVHEIDAGMVGSLGGGVGRPPEPPYDIRIDGLTAAWRRGRPDVLRGITVAVPAGRRVAITGPSGSGKTTLAMVLLRFLDPSGGTVTLGGTDITTLPGDTVRTIIGLCAQDAHIFDSTLAENLRLARPGAGDAALRDALRRARLLDWADSLPDGLDTLVGEHGARLSGGQRQRLALARVLLADFPVVILDEPTEHLDEPTAAALTRDLLAETHGRTVLLITHRTGQLTGVDEVVRLGHGRRLEQDGLEHGRHEDGFPGHSAIGQSKGQASVCAI